MFGRLVRLIGLLSVFYSSAQGFAYGFLQIPPRGGHPCFQLILPTVGRIVDFHHLVIAHVGRTKKERTPERIRSHELTRLSSGSNCHLLLKCLPSFITFIQDFLETGGFELFIICKILFDAHVTDDGRGTV